MNDHRINLIENNEKICRICLESDNPEDLFSPCLCDGTSKYVHRNCLNQWRILHDINSDNFKKCELCQTVY